MEDKRENITDEGFPGVKAEDLAEFINKNLGGDWRQTCIYMLRLTIADTEIQKQLLEQGVTESVPKHLQVIVACAKELGWGFAVPKDELDFNGFVIGNEDYINKIFSRKQSHELDLDFVQREGGIAQENEQEGD